VPAGSAKRRLENNEGKERIVLGKNPEKKKKVETMFVSNRHTSTKKDRLERPTDTDRRSNPAGKKEGAQREIKLESGTSEEGGKDRRIYGARRVRPGREARPGS